MLIKTLFATFTKKIVEYRALLNDLYLIYTSGLFNKVWYLAKNPDVDESGTNPLLHYLLHGGFEGRDPGPYFCSRWYLDAYEEARNDKINPLVHFLKYGRKIGYLPQAPIMDYVNSVYFSSTVDFNRSSLLSNPANQKIFCIGQNKTGTTSIGKALVDFGYQLGHQGEAEILMEDWIIRDFRRIIQFCKTANAFQDVPFSLDYTYQVLDHEFPGSKFILTIRNNADEWFESLIRFHSKIIGVRGVPTAADLKNFTSGGKGWLWRYHQRVYGANEETLYEKELYKAYYTNYNNRVIDYFRYRKRDLLVINLSEPSAMRSLCEFLEIPYTGQEMPHLNRTD